MKKSTKSEKPAAPQVKSSSKKTVEPAPVKKTVAPKKVPTPKKAALAVAPQPTVVRQPATPAAAPAMLPVSVDTTIVAQIDVGFGNHLFIRGEGPGLSWEQGTPMTCVDDHRWSFTISGTTKPIVFKFLVNDVTWNVGEDYAAAPGSTVVLTPTFS